jgi:O-antigen/teichoic acid export membrane protein
MAIRRTYAKTAAFSFILTIVGFVINIVYGRIIADILPESDMGTIAALVTLATVIEGIAIFGITYTITQKTSSSIGRSEVEVAKGILAKGLIIFYATSIPFSVILTLLCFFVLSSFFFYNLFIWSGLLIPYIVLLILLRSESTAMDCMVETDKSVVFTNLRRYLSWGLSLGFLFFLMNFVGIIYGWLLSTSLFVIIGIFLVSKYFSGVNLRDGLPSGTYLTFGLLIFAASVVRLIGRYFDQLFILALLTPEDLAQYFLVARITGSLFEFSVSLIAGIIAILSVLVGASLNRMYNAHSAVMRFVLVISAPLYLTVAAFGEALTTLFLGPRYIGSGILLSILAIAGFFDLIVVLLLMGRQASGRTKIIPLTWASLLIFKFLLVTILAAFGLIGISFGVLLSQILLALILSLYLRKEISLGVFWLKLSIPMIIVLALGLSSTLLGLNAILAVTLAVFSGLIAIFVVLRLRILPTNDIIIIRSVISPKLKWIVDLIIRIGGYPRKEFSTLKDDC